MSSFTLKLIGIITMLIDHIGVLFFPGVLLFRIIGRLAFFIFAFLISEGYRKTSNLNHYMLRMFVFAVISQFTYAIAFGNLFYLNILFTFLLSLFAINLYEEDDNILFILAIALLAQLINADYGAYGVLIVFIFHQYHGDIKNIIEYTALTTFIYVCFNMIMEYSVTNDLYSLFSYSIQLFALVSLGFIYFYNQKRGRAIKYLFYIFYPGHMLLLYLIKVFLSHSI